MALSAIAEKSVVAAKEERTKYVEYREGIVSRSEYVAYKMRQEGRLHDLGRQKEKLEADRKNLDTVSGKYLAAASGSFGQAPFGYEKSRELMGRFVLKIVCLCKRK